MRVLIHLPFEWHWTESQIMSTQLWSKEVWEERSSKIRKMMFCESGVKYNVLNEHYVFDINLLLTVWMIIRTSKTSIGTDVLENHSLLHRQTFIRQRSILKTRHHSDTVLTSLVLNSSVGRHHGGHGDHGRQHVLHDGLYNCSYHSQFDNYWTTEQV